MFNIYNWTQLIFLQYTNLLSFSASILLVSQAPHLLRTSLEKKIIGPAFQKNGEGSGTKRLYRKAKNEGEIVLCSAAQRDASHKKKKEKRPRIITLF